MFLYKKKLENVIVRFLDIGGIVDHRCLSLI